MATPKNQNDSVDPGGFNEFASTGQQKPAPSQNAVDPGGFHEISAVAEVDSDRADDTASGSATDPQT